MINTKKKHLIQTSPEVREVKTFTLDHDNSTS